MRRAVVVFSIVSAWAVLASAALDVAMAAATTRASRQDWSLAGAVRGDTTATFLLTDGGRLGTTVSRGQFIADGSEIAIGASPYSVATTQIFMLDDGRDVRAVVDGYGQYSGATGQDATGLMRHKPLARRG